MSKNYIFVLILVYLVVLIVSFVNLLSHNFKTESKNKELQNKILGTQLQIKDQELQYLKKQIHPHFLFNTLNTIYGFALKQSKDTPELILKLSNLLDYILYQVDKPLVSLNNEITHLKDYIELEKIRFEDTLRVSFKSNEVIENVQIAPMLLIPFVENAFKHGNLVNGILKVDIEIIINKGRLDFDVRNSYIDKLQKKEDGIGIENIKKRLDLLYGKNFSLNIKTGIESFEVQLSIFDLNH